MLGIECAPMTWPIGMGKRFRGVPPATTTRTISFWRPAGRRHLETIIEGLDNRRVDELLGPRPTNCAPTSNWCAAPRRPFCAKKYLAGKQTPVFFGSAEQLRRAVAAPDAVVERRRRRWRSRRCVVAKPAALPERGEVHRLRVQDPGQHGPQAPRPHRLPARLLRPLRARHEVKQVAGGKTISVNNAITFMARDRSTTDEAFPGDILGIPNHGTIRLGETFTEGEDLRFTGIPSFAPEHFRLARITVEDQAIAQRSSTTC